MLMRLTITTNDFTVSGYYDNADDLEAALDPLSDGPVPIDDIMNGFLGQMRHYYTAEGYSFEGVPIVSLIVKRVPVNTTWEGLRYESN